MSTEANSNNKIPTRSIAAGLAAALLALGGYAIGKSNTSDTATAAAGPQAAAQMPQQQTGQAPPGFGTQATGVAAEKAKAAAVAKYPGNVEGVMQLSDGSYVVHVITSSGEVHVAVSKDFTVTGTEQGPAGGPASSS